MARPPAAPSIAEPRQDELAVTLVMRRGRPIRALLKSRAPFGPDFNARATALFHELCAAKGDAIERISVNGYLPFEDRL